VDVGIGVGVDVGVGVGVGRGGKLGKVRIKSLLITGKPELVSRT